ncbi:hypothetical protein ABMA28_001014 [Loxostege sticticalis]|uniref:Uncharacterized protein n=1 Tax=Loxostege sticticalis TaxID=481309 RepID=A0ABD0T4B1_LOXSC
MTTLLPAIIVQHCKTFLVDKIGSYSNVQLIYLEFRHGDKLLTTLQVPKGEITFFKYKAQHETQMSEEWIEALLTPLKTYLTANYPYEETLVSVRYPLMTLELNRIPLPTQDTNCLQEEIRHLTTKIRSLCCLYVRTKLLMREKQRNYYAKLLKGLPPNSLITLNKDLKLQYQLPRQEGK